MLDLFEQEAEIEDRPNAIELNHQQPGSIEFRHVSFHYKPGNLSKQAFFFIADSLDGSHSHLKISTRYCSDKPRSLIIFNFYLYYPKILKFL